MYMGVFVNSKLNKYTDEVERHIEKLRVKVNCYKQSLVPANYSAHECHRRIHTNQLDTKIAATVTISYNYSNMTYIPHSTMPNTRSLQLDSYCQRIKDFLPIAERSYA